MSGRIVKNNFEKSGVLGFFMHAGCCRYKKVNY